MKVSRECSLCLLERALKISKFLGIEKEKWFSLWNELLHHFHKELDEESVPAIIGTSRERIIQEVLQIEDPYEQIKRKSHKIGKKVAKALEKELDFSKHDFNQFRRLCIYASQANALEWFIKGHKPRIDEFLQLLKEGEDDLVIDETEELWEQVTNAKEILYLLDNSGESEIDYLTIKFLKKMGKELFIGAKTKPILNDITIKEARKLGFAKLGVLVPTGHYVGTLLDERAPSELRRVFNQVDLVIAKGMGSYETLSEYQSMSTPCFIGLKAKCKSVAKHIGVQQGDLVIKRLF